MKYFKKISCCLLALALAIPAMSVWTLAAENGYEGTASGYENGLPVERQETDELEFLPSDDTPVIEEDPPAELFFARSEGEIAVITGDASVSAYRAEIPITIVPPNSTDYRQHRTIPYKNQEKRPSVAIGRRKA